MFGQKPIRLALACLVSFLAVIAVDGQETSDERLEALERKVEEQQRLLETLQEEKHLEGDDDPERSESRRLLDEFEIFYKDRFGIRSRDGRFALTIGGRMDIDFGFFHEDREIRNTFGRIEDGVEFRRARIELGGVVYSKVEFRTEYDFSDAAPEFADVWIGLKDVPGVGVIRVGHQKEPFGLEINTSDKYLTFTELGLPFDTLGEGRNTGVRIGKSEFDERMTWAAGVFRQTDEFGSGRGDGEWDAVGRITFLPWVTEDEEHVLHVGGAYRYAKLDDFDFSLRPETAQAPRFLDTGAFPAEDIHVFGFEAAWVMGPLSVQHEYVHAIIDPETGSNPRVHGYYGFVSYFLTGERRVYKRSSATFGRVKPKENFWDGNGGWGAWEVAARFSHADLDSKSIQGGELTDYTGGINWYWNPHTRVQANYVYADLEDVGDAHLVTVRFHIDF